MRRSAAGRGAASGATLQHRGVTPKLVRYEAPGWGVGEVWLEGERVVWSELPDRRRHGVGGGRTAHPLARAARARSSPASRTTSPTSSSSSTTASTATASGRCGRVPRGEVVTYGELAALAGRPGRGPRGGHVLRPEPARAVRPVPPRRRGRRDRRLRLARRSSTSGACSRSTMSLSDELRDELAAIAPRRRCCRLAELSALFHSAGAWHLHGHGELAVHLDLASRGRRAARVHAPARPRRPLGDPDVPPPRVRPRDALPAPRRGRRGEPRAPPRGGRPLGARARRSSARRSASSAARAAAARTSAARCSAAARSPARARRTSSCARPAATAREFVAERRRPRGHRAPGRASAAAHAIAYAKGGETIADLLAVAGAGETALRLDEHAVVAATRAEANRLANADEANLVRTTRRGARAAPGDPSSSRASGCRRSCRRSPTSASGTRGSRSTELAAKCRPPITKAAAQHRMAALKHSRRCRIHSGIDHAAALSRPARSTSSEARGHFARERRAGGEAPRTTFPSG